MERKNTKISGRRGTVMKYKIKMLKYLEAKVGPKCNTGETLQACVTRQLLKSINAGNVNDALHIPLFSYGSSCTCPTSHVYHVCLCVMCVAPS